MTTMLVSRKRRGGTSQIASSKGLVIRLVSRLLCLGLAVSVALAPSSVSAQTDGTGEAVLDQEVTRTFDHTGWDFVLNSYVTDDGRFDYQGLLAHPTDIDRLTAYLERIELANLFGLPDHELIAFWVNAYNACAVRGVLDHYPIQSAMNVVGFFDTPRCSIAGSTLSLNEIENEQIGRRFTDAGIHFALCSVSRGSPPIRSEAYTGASLTEQLTNQSHNFVRETTQVRPNLMEVELSKLFEWFSHDFDGMGGVRTFVAANLDPEEGELIGQPAIVLTYSDWDWRLNEPE